MKALWHTINALKVNWHASVPVRSIFAAPLRRLRSLVSTDTQLFDSLSRLCHVHVWIKPPTKNQPCSVSAHAHPAAAANPQTAISRIMLGLANQLIISTPLPLATWIWFQSTLSKSVMGVMKALQRWTYKYIPLCSLGTRGDIQDLQFPLSTV